MFATIGSPGGRRVASSWGVRCVWAPDRSRWVAAVAAVVSAQTTRDPGLCLDATNGTIAGVHSGLCLDASSNGTRAILWTCGTSANQQWTPD
jgi:hypothetical protein